MRLATVVLFVSVLALSASAFADFTYVGKIPAPSPDYVRPVLGMTHDEYHLFVTVDTDTTPWFYLIDENDGDIMASHQWLHHEFGWPRLADLYCKNLQIPWC